MSPSTVAEPFPATLEDANEPFAGVERRRLQRADAAEKAAVLLPDHDIRQSLDEAVRRGWTEHTRHVARGVALVIADTAAGFLGIAFVLNTWWLVSNGGLRPLPNPIPLLAMVCCIQPLALCATGTYGGGRARVSAERIVAGIAISIVAGWIQAHLFGRIAPDLPDKTAYLYSGIVIAVFVWLERLAFDQGLKGAFRAGFLQRRVLLIAHRDELEQVQRRIDHATVSDVKVVAALTPRHLGLDPAALDDAIASSRAQAVVIASNIRKDDLEPLMTRCFTNGIGISLLPGGIQDVGSAYFELRPSNVGLLMEVYPMRFGLPQLFIKRTMDIVLTTIGLAITWPVFALIAIAIKLDSKGPVLFKQTRVGVGGKPFRMMKFRTMRDGADAMKGDLLALNESGDPRLFKIKNDPRVTRVGRILRKLSLDELPQVFNVLKGEMSLVGPRPFFRGDLPSYEAHHFERLHVLPGITGLWQVSGRSDIIDFEEVVRLDREYIRNWSVASDLLILLKTLPAALGRGAY